MCFGSPSACRAVGVPAFAVVVIVLVLPQARAEPEAEAIQKQILGAMKAGWEQRDLKTYVAVWASDARNTSGRAEQPGKYDLTLKREQIEATRRLRFQDQPGVTRMTFEGAKVRVKGDEAELRVRTKAEFEGGWEMAEEVYHLRKTPAGWRIHDNRWWPVQAKLGNKEMTYDAAFWKEKDARVDQARKDGDLRVLAAFLADAYRFAEGHEVCKEITKPATAQSRDWVLRGHMALLAGDARDCLDSFARALKLEKDAPVPSYAKPQDGKK